jgi:hypothetical protein
VKAASTLDQLTCATTSTGITTTATNTRDLIRLGSAAAPSD